VGGDGTQAPDKTLAGIFGFDHYLRKPYDPQALIALLAQVRKQPKQPKQPTKAG
jgi:DNA-binding response OmpR family regulator